MINHIDFSRDQSKDFSCDQSKIKIAETLFFNLDKEHYKNSRKLQELIWDKLVAYVNDFNLRKVRISHQTQKNAYVSD
ncbi:hypothetical protein MYX70_004956 [Escherichia coli]|nr:hypothetical protein [Escherichia coli]